MKQSDPSGLERLDEVRSDTNNGNGGGGGKNCDLSLARHADAGGAVFSRKRLHFYGWKHT
jgi:hypothetical protein